MSDLTDWFSAVSAIASAVAAGTALAISKKALATAETVARIERDRWRHDMTPVFTATITPLGVGTQKASLLISLEGPTALDRLESMSVEIRDDGYTHLPGVNATAEQIAATIWGPYRFQPGIDDASDDGRRVPAAAMAVGDWRKLILERTTPPTWSGPEYWNGIYDDEPVRLLIRCSRRGQEPWVVPLEVSVADPTNLAH